VVVAGAFDSPSIDFGGGAKTNLGSLDGFVAKLTGAAGNHVWSTLLGGGNQQQPTSVAVAPVGDVYVCGSYQGTPDFGTGALGSGVNFDYFLVKLASGGAATWAKGFGDTAPQTACSVAADSANNPIIAVTLQGNVDFGGGALMAMGADVAVVKLNPMGVYTWSKQYGDGDIQDAKGVAVDGLDRVLVTGSLKGTVNFGAGNVTANGYDAYVLRLTPAGAHDLSKIIGAVNDQFGVDVVAGENNSIVAVGTFDNSIDFGAPSMPMSGSSVEGYVVKYDSGGAPIWSRGFVNNGEQKPLGVATSMAGDVAIAGSFTTSIDFGGGVNQHNSSGGTDLFVVQLRK
jgi:hypothetical protein